MSKKNKARRKIVKWHKRLGIVSAFFVLLLSITGFFLNHSSSFDLGRRFIGTNWLLDLYAVPELKIHSASLGNDWLSEASSHLYFNQNYLTQCHGHLVSALQREEYWIAACSENIVLFSHDNQVVEKIGRSLGMPTPLQRIGECGPKICIKSLGSVYEIDLDALEWREPESVEIEWRRLAQAPEPLVATIVQAARARVITWEKLIMDLHAGRFFGVVGPVVMDLFAILFIALAGTGIYLWGVKHIKKKCE